MIKSTCVYMVSKYRSSLKSLTNGYPKVLISNSRQLSRSVQNARKIYTETENKYAYETLKLNGHIKAIQLEQVPTASIDNLDSYLQQQWSSKSHEELCDTFGVLAQHSFQNNICISNTIFDAFIDCLTDHIQYFTDSQLEKLFLYLKLWPETESVRTRNFIEVWAALDDACIERYKKWSNEEKLKFAALTFELNISRACDYTYKCVQRLTSRASSLSVSELLLTSFFMSVLRNSPEDKHKFELYLEEHFEKFSINDLSILSMGFFKSKSPIRNVKLLHMLIDKVIVEKEVLEDVPLTALLKVIRYSYRISESTEPMRRLLSAMQSEVSRLSIMACVHLALLGTSCQFLHESIINKILERVTPEIDKTRVKDIERIILTLSQFNHRHPNIDFVTIAMEELRKPERENEIMKYGRSYAQCIAFVTILNSFPTDHIDRVLSESFLEKAYGKVLTNYGRELLVIDNTVEIHCPGYEGHRLTRKVNKYLAKSYTDYVPDENWQKQFNVTEKFILEVMKNLREITGDKSKVCADHALPHYQRGVIFVCQDSTNNFIDVSQHFPINPFGPIHKAPANNKWIAVIIAGRNGFMKETGHLTGPALAKLRDHKKIGYYPVIVSWFDWIKLESDKAKKEFILNLLKKAVNE